MLPVAEWQKTGETNDKQISSEDLAREPGVNSTIYYGIHIFADDKNQNLITKALELMNEKTPEFFKLVYDNVKEIRQSKSHFSMGPVRSVPGMDRIEFRNFSGEYSAYNVADFLVHEATHIIDQKRGLSYTKEAEIRAREAEIAFFLALEKVEGRSFKDMIRFVDNEINMIKKGHLYGELP